MTAGRRARRWGAVGAALVLAGALVPAAAEAVPGTPGVPQAPRVAFAENFENGVGAAPVGLAGYVGASGQTYTAAPPWLTACNGVILEFASPAAAAPASGCAIPSSYDRVRQLAYALGVHAGAASPTTNNGVTAYTENSPGVDLIQFETRSPIALATSGRFITFSVDAAEVNCFANHALFKFYLLDGAIEIPTFTTPIDPCTDPGSRTITAPAVGGSGAIAARTGTYAGNSAVLFNGSALGIRMRNGQGSGGGNDAAFDNIRVLDVTPQLDKAFSPTSLDVGRASTLTFTITNTSELAAKRGWAFGDALPAGLVVANPAAASTTCPNGFVIAPPGGNGVQVTGDLNAGQASCTVSVNVTSSAAGTYTNGPSNVTGRGIDAPGPSAVSFRAADLSIVKSASPGIAVPGTNETYALVVRNDGPDAAIDVTVSDPLPEGLTFVSASPECRASGQTVTCSVASMAPGASQTFTVVAGVASSVSRRLENTATVTSQTPDPDPGDNTSTATVPIGGEADLTIAKTASTATVGPGGQVLYTLVVGNDGPSDATRVTVTDPPSAGLVVVSARSSQGSCTVAGGGLSCSLGGLVRGGTAQILVTAQVGGAAAGTIVNTARVTGDQRDPDPANNSVSEAVTVPAPPPPGPQPRADLTITKQGDRTGVVGRPLTYRIVVVNGGPAAATGVSVTDTMSVPARVLSVRATAGSCQTSVPVTCSLGTIRSGDRVTITIVIEPRVSGTLRNAASVTGEGLDPRTADNLAVVATQVKRPLTLTKVANHRTVRAGQTVMYTIRVRNPSTVAVRDVQTCDTLPSGLVLVGATPRARLINGRYCWTTRSLGAGRSKTYTPTVRALNGPSERRVNRAAATSPDTGTARARRAVSVRGGRLLGGGVTG